MTARIGTLVLPLLGWQGGKTLIRGELRDILTLRAEPAGLSLDALEAALVPEVCGEVWIEQNAETLLFEGYTMRAMLARDATEGDCIRIILAKPSELDELRAVMGILTGETE